MKTKIITLLKLSREGLPETALRYEIEIKYRATVGEMEFGSALAELEAAGFATSATDELTGDKVWKLTAKGSKR